MRKLLVLLLAISMVFALIGCGGAAPEEEEASPSDITVAFVPKLTGNSFFESANLGAQDIASQVGFEAIYTGSPEAAVANQVQVINSAVQQGVSALAISALTPDGLNNALQAAKDAGIKIVTWDSDVQNDMRSLMVAQGTPQQLGEMLVEMVAMQLPDDKKENATYAWHYSSPTVTDQNSWQVYGEKYIKEAYPGWVNVFPDNFYSNQDAEKAVSTGESILKTYPDIDAIICNDSTALPGQAQAAENLGLTGKDVIITGFATPNGMRNFVKNGTVNAFGLWDCKVQGAMGAYLGYWLAAGNTFVVGDMIDIPGIGEVKVMPNTVLDENAYTADDSGVVLMPERTIFTIDNIDDFDF